MVDNFYKGNFYIGIVHHKKRVLKSQYDEKIVLYTNNDIDYIDLINNVVYSTDCSEKDYVVKESLILTDISEHRIDYIYLLNQYDSKAKTRKKVGNYV